jgi:cytochrome P450
MLIRDQYETLRLFTPAGITNKWSVIEQPIVFKGTTYMIPKSTRISINGTAVHYNPEVWGPDPQQFNPHRWLREECGGSASKAHSEPFTSPSSPGTPDSTDVNTHSESSSHPRQPSMPSINQGLAVFKPARGTYLPFSEGARACAGKKFATVEFVAVLVTLLRDHRLTLEEGWSAEGVAKVLQGRKAGALTLQPPEVIPLRLVRRFASL